MKKPLNHLVENKKGHLTGLMTAMPIGIGICSLVMMFISLTVTCLSSLTLMTCYKEAKLTEKSIERTRAYYAAEAQANALLLEIGEIYDIYASTSGVRQELLVKALSEIQEVMTIEVEGHIYITYKVPIDEKQAIKVMIEVISDTESRAEIKVKSWKLEAVTWDYEEETFSEVTIS